MPKSRLQISVVVLLFSLYANAQDKYFLRISGIDKDSAFIVSGLSIRTEFANRNECIGYVNELPGYLKGKGYVTASIDHISYDSAYASLQLFVGDKYQWAQIDTKNIDPSVLETIGWREQSFTGQPMNFEEINEWQDKILLYMENNGHPFAKISLDSLRIEGDKAYAQLKLQKGPHYKFDSIRIVGNAKVSNEFLQRYLDIRNGSEFSKEKLLRISKRIRELPYVEEESPPKLIWLMAGSIVELYLKQKKSSQANVIIGFLPNNDQLSSKKLLVTGEANLNLKNALGAGETIGLNWQQLQVKSPRLNIFYQHPYLFKTPVGLDFAFNMFRKDSTFLNINYQVGAQYSVNIHQSGKLFLQRFQTIVNGVDKNFILQYYRLPDAADVNITNLGLEYELNNTNYRQNPSRGNELRVTGTVGRKTIKKNNEVLELKDPGNPAFDFNTLYDTVKLKTYQFSVKAYAAKYFPLGKNNRSTVKTAINAGLLQSSNIFRNELFQIGGYKLLRGFDEESQYLSQFGIATVEYRYLAGQNSYFYAFGDGGWGRNNSQNTDIRYTYIGAGLGLVFQTGAGIFNLAWAIGKRSDLDFNLRQSKIHFGFASYF
jgi:outer membrane protein assembly factor BamA